MPAARWAAERQIARLDAVRYGSGRTDGIRESKRARTRGSTQSEHDLHIEANRLGNRPVRAIVPASIVSELFRGFDACRHGSNAVSFFSKDIHAEAVDFGTTRHVGVVEDADNARASKVRSRGRIVIPVDRFREFLKRFCNKELDAFEAECAIKIMQCAPAGVLLCDRRTGKIMNRQYGTDAYRLAGALIFLDRVGSSAQNDHIDVQGCDRDAVWNLVLPLSMGECDRPRVAASAFVPPLGGRTMGLGEATMWDGGWNHRGLGNDTSEPRIYLHLLFLPYWMVVPDPEKQQWHFADTALRAHIRDLARGSGKSQNEWAYLRQIQKSLADEYNEALSLHAEASPLRSWVEHVRSTIEPAHPRE